MDQKKINQILRISKLYYELDLGQVEIAAKEGISKSTVSRLLKAGKDMGLVEVRIKEPMLSFGDLEAQLLSQFPLKRVTIVPDFVNNPQILLRDVCTALAEDLPRYLYDDCTLGVAWGSTLEMLSTLLIPLTPGFCYPLSGAIPAIHNPAPWNSKKFCRQLGWYAMLSPPCHGRSPFIAEAN